LQQLLAHPPAYLLENTYMLWPHTPRRVRFTDLPDIIDVLGPYFTSDAARFGSGAYRLRMFWSNLQSAAHMDLTLSQWQRPSDLPVRLHLDKGRAPLRLGVSRRQPPPNYPCNLDPAVVEVLPTLVSFPASHAYRDGKAGVLWDARLACEVEPNVEERERLLGYTTGTTAAPGLSWASAWTPTSCAPSWPPPLRWTTSCPHCSLQHTCRHSSLGAAWSSHLLLHRSCRVLSSLTTLHLS
jgi:hypothetical protein